MPLIVELILGILRGVLNLIFKSCFSNEKDHNMLYAIVNFIITIIVVVCLAKQMYDQVGLNEYRSRLWIKNFVQSIFPNLTFVNLILIIINYWIFCLLKTKYAQNSPKIKKVLTGMLKPEMLILMVHLFKENN